MSFELPTTYGENADLAIPRVYTEFDPNGAANNTEFSITIPASDLKKATSLAKPLSYIPRPPAHQPIDIVLQPDIEEQGAALRTNDDGDTVQVQFGFSPLPEIEESAAPKNFFEKMKWINDQRRPIAAGWSQVFARVLELTNIQYQFGVPNGAYDTDLPPAPARWSYRGGQDTSEPQIIVSRHFDDTLTSLDHKSTVWFTNEIEDYLTKLHLVDQSNIFHPLSHCEVGSYGKLIGNGISSVGRRSEYLTKDEIRRHHTKQDYRLQTGDAYVASGHNMADIDNPEWLAMLAIGILSRETLARLRQP